VDLLIWLLYAAGAYILVASSYRLIVSLKVLTGRVAETTAKLNGFGPDEVEITKASPSSPEDLPKLLRDQRRRVRAKAQAKEQRRLTLISRISSINIDKRSA
jgi:hypothetical protein